MVGRRKSKKKKAKDLVIEERRGRGGQSGVERNSNENSVGLFLAVSMK